MLDEQALGNYIDRHFTRTLFRLECLPSYDVSSDGEDFARFLAGEAEPTWERKQPWLDHLRQERERGLYSHRVRVLTTPLSDYLRYACTWGYALNSEAGEDIRVLNISEKSPPDRLVSHDFWLIDNAQVVVMHYDDAGHYIGAKVAPEHALGRYREARDAAWTAAEPFTTWWAHQPKQHPGRAA